MSQQRANRRHHSITSSGRTRTAVGSVRSALLSTLDWPDGTRGVRARYTFFFNPEEELSMMKIALAVAAAAAVLTTVPLVTPAKAEGIKMAQGVDVQVGRDRDDRYRDRRRYDSDTTVGVGPGGVAIGPRQRCHYETTTIERGDGRSITRRERICD